MRTILEMGTIFFQGKFQELNRLIFEDGKISEIQLSGSKAKKPKLQAKGKLKTDVEVKEKVISCAGKFILPGFIDAHTHFGLVEEGIGWVDADMNECYGQVTPHVRAIDALKLRDQSFKDALLGGITCCLVAPGSSSPIGGQACIIKLRGNTVEEAILRENAGLKFAFGENPKQNYGEQKKFPSSRMGIAAMIREWLMRAQDYSKRKKTKDFRERDIKLEALLPLLEGKVQVRAHAHLADDIITAYRIAQEFNLDLVIDHCTEGHLISKELGRWKARVVVGPAFVHRWKPELRHQNFSTPRILMDEGCLVALSTDYPVIPIEGLSLAAALSVRHGLDETRAIKAISENPAMILGLDKRLGKLESGFDADIVIWGGHPLDVRSKVELVFIEGNQVVI